MFGWLNQIFESRIKNFIYFYFNLFIIYQLNILFIFVGLKVFSLKSLTFFWDRTLLTPLQVKNSDHWAIKNFLTFFSKDTSQR